MKRKLVLAISLIMCSAFLLSGCGIFSIIKKVKDTEENQDAHLITIVPEASATPEIVDDDKTDNDENANSEERKQIELKVDDLYLIDDIVDIVFDDIKVTIPNEWVNKVYVSAYENGISFMQKLSYDKFQGGFIVGISKADNNVPDYTGEVMVAYTDDNAYYFSYPSDVPYDYEDDVTAQDYADLAMVTDKLEKSLIVDSENVHYDAYEFLAPMSATKKLEENYVYNFNINQLSRMRDEILARHGQIFDDDLDQWYFDKMSWYKSRTDAVSTDELNETEYYNFNYLMDLINERIQSKAYPYSILIGSSCTDVFSEDAAGTTDTITYRYDGSFEDGFKGYIKVDKHEWDLETDFGISLDNPESDYYYFLEPSDYFDDKLIMIVDLGTNDGCVTYYFTVDGAKNLIYVGMLNGSPVKGVGGNPQDGTCETNILTVLQQSQKYGLGCYYRSYWYNRLDRVIEDNTWGNIMPMLPSCKKTALKDLDAVENIYNVDNTKVVIEADTELYFTGTDDAEWLKVKIKETGKELYINLNETLKGDIYEYFDGIE